MRADFQGRLVTIEAIPRTLVVCTLPVCGPRHDVLLPHGPLERVAQVSSPEGLTRSLRQGGWDLVVEDVGTGSVDPTDARLRFQQQVPGLPVLLRDRWTRAAADRASGPAAMGLTVGPGGRILSVGGDCRRVLGRPGEEVLHRSLGSLFGHDERMVLAELKVNGALFPGRSVGPRVLRLEQEDGARHLAFVWAQDFEPLPGVGGMVLFIRLLRR